MINVLFCSLVLIFVFGKCWYLSFDFIVVIVVVIELILRCNCFILMVVFLLFFISVIVLFSIVILIKLCCVRFFRVLMGVWVLRYCGEVIMMWWNMLMCLVLRLLFMSLFKWIVRL